MQSIHLYSGILSLIAITSCQRTDSPILIRERYPTEPPNQDLLITIGPYSDGHSDHDGHDHSGDHAAGKQSDKSGLPFDGIVKCYNCSSHPNREGADCLGEIDAKFLIECESDPDDPQGNFTGCWKQEQWLDFDMNSTNVLTSKHHYVIRHCGHQGNVKGKICDFRSAFGVRQNNCFCQGVGCNSADSLTTGLVAIVSTAISVALARS